MRILYGVCGQGMGHATRSKVVITQLKKKHDVTIVAGDSAFKYLSSRFSNVNEIFTLRLIYDHNRVRRIKTTLHNISKYPKIRVESVLKLRNIIENFKPELIISDFEFFSAVAAKEYGLPLISIDNIHMLSRCKVDIPKTEFDSYLTAKIVVDNTVRHADYYFISTFFKTRPKKNTFLIAPILRKEIIEANTKIGDYILVYQTLRDEKLIGILKKIDERFIAYGCGENIKEENIIFRKFNEGKFFIDLAGCKAIITNGGYSLISEGISLHKPIFSVPVRKQFEQTCNAIYLDKLGYGMYQKRANLKAVQDFLSKLPDYRKNLGKFEKKDNSDFFSLLELTIEKLKP